VSSTRFGIGQPTVLATLSDGSEAEVPWLVGLRDRAPIGVLVYSFARISAVVAMKVEDHCANGKRWVRLHEKVGSATKYRRTTSMGRSVRTSVFPGGRSEEGALALFAEPCRIEIFVEELLERESPRTTKLYDRTVMRSRWARSSALRFERPPLARGFNIQPLAPKCRKLLSLRPSPILISGSHRAPEKIHPTAAMENNPKKQKPTTS
jgi:hypothetical protein